MRYVTLRKLLTISLLHFTDITGGHIGDAACRHEGTGNRRARGRPLARSLPQRPVCSRRAPFLRGGGAEGVPTLSILIQGRHENTPKLRLVVHLFAGSYTKRTDLSTSLEMTTWLRVSPATPSPSNKGEGWQLRAAWWSRMARSKAVTEGESGRDYCFLKVFY